MEFKDKIESIIKEAAANPGTETRYREPLVGYAAADDPIFDEMKEIIGSHHLHPKEVFPGVKTVVSFFLPFDKKLVELNWRSSGPIKEWIRAKSETDNLIGKINEKLKAALAEEGIEAVVPGVVFDYNCKGFDVAWSHKSAAYAAGLGTLGVNRMLITKAGCAGRFGTLLISAVIPPTPRPTEEFCRYKKGEKCLVCVDRCPAGALSIRGLDKEKCYRQLQENARAFPELNLFACGKCATGPCALRSR
ncbi:Iron-sulfur cluster-binding protein [Methanosarcina siciliae T4/M]|uniref:Iron-sulfur cluster-binding protein n=1 Tax=Methanosarcina siciliae T4/M TaxID=1434120 RepID=A0A0E3P8N8_9EURY|nr:epoxyqueuosine reductase [Methanosarcina siciliae]AKB30318.1 Iron-sulfur cluster-binding protein [Methanosarcina siciliae T4/M]